MVEIEGIKIYGEPRTPTFGHGWAYNVNRRGSSSHWDLVPDDIDILLTHGPPDGCGDAVTYPPGEHVGCESMRRMLHDHPNIKVVICGHIHESYGHYRMRGIDVYNVAQLNLQYQPVNSPVEFEL